jgi:hypothetical protein
MKILDWTTVAFLALASLVTAIRLIPEIRARFK